MKFKLDITNIIENIISNYLYQILALLVVGVIIPAITPTIPLVKNIQPKYISGFLVAILILSLIVIKIFRFGKRTYTIRRNTNIFHFRQNSTEEDKSKNKELLMEKCGNARDIYILGATGYRTYARKDQEDQAILRDKLEHAKGEIRVLLLLPLDKNIRARERAGSLAVPFDDYKNEIIKSTHFLKELKTNKGKNISLKFYTQKPIWKLIILDDFMWVQYYHPDKHVEHSPVYGILRDASGKHYSLFDPLYDVFRKKWDYDDNSIFDFKTDEIVYFDGTRETLSL